MGLKPYKLEESAYVIRRVELNHRHITNPWSIRQTGVYHGIKTDVSPSAPKLRLINFQSRFLLIAASINAESKIAQYLKEAAVTKTRICPWVIHRIIISDSLAGWQDYMASIESKLRDQTIAILCATNDGNAQDWDDKFGRQQGLNVLEGFVMDLMVIVPTMLDTIDGLRLQCRSFLERNSFLLTTTERITHEMILNEFDEYIKDAKLNVDRARELKFRTESTVNLLSLFLSQRSNESMHQLTEKSMKDAAAVKILTVITLIYLPTTIVAVRLPM